MKKLMFAAALMSVFTVVAADAAKTAKNATPAEKPADDTNLEKQEKQIFSGFANYGIYSGYQLYGSIVNTEPVLQGYAELNAALSWDDLDLGQFGGGVWNNSDLTGKRTASYRRAFNEFDFNIHWQKMFWFDEDKTWGLFYRTYVVWYFYPHTGGKRDGLALWYAGNTMDPTRRRGTATTFDWDHYFELANPYVIPYINIVHEYEQSHGNLIQFGLKKPMQITDNFSICPFIEAVWRNRNYGWCFSDFGKQMFPYNGNTDSKIEAGIATVKLELDATYMFTKNFGVFAKVAYCQNVDPNLRHEANEMGSPRALSMYDTGANYGRWNEFCWGGVGICLNF